MNNIKQPISSPPIGLIDGYEKNKYINTYQQDQNIFNKHLQINNLKTIDNININKPSTPTYYHINKENRKKLRNKLNNQNCEQSIPLPDHQSTILGPGSQSKLEYEMNNVYNRNNIFSKINDNVIDLNSSLSNKLKLSDCLIINNDNDLPIIDILAHVQDDDNQKSIDGKLDIYLDISNYIYT